MTGTSVATTSSRRSGAVTVRHLMTLLAASAVLFTLGLFSDSTGLAEYMYLIPLVLFWVTQATSWNILSGFAGYFSFGQGAFLGIGVYATAVLTGRNDVHYLIAIPVGGLLAGALALVIGAVAFRLRSLRGEIFALLTLCVPFLLEAIARNTRWIDGGVGSTIPTPEWPGWVPNFQHLMFFLNLGIATIAIGTALLVHRSRFGRGLSAVHDAEDAAEVLGVPTFRYKMVAIVLSAVLSGMSGAVFGMMLGRVEPETVFILYYPLLVILMCVLGGRRHWLGPVIGAVVLALLQNQLTSLKLDDYRDIILGALLTGMVVLAPDGLFERLRARPWVSLGVFVVAFAGLWFSDVYTVLDALLYAMIATAVIATVASIPAISRRLPGRKSAASSPSIAAEPEPAPAPVYVHPTPAPSPSPAGGKVLVSINRVTKDFGGVRALDTVSFDVREGEIVGLVGPNGSGKTTLVNLLSGALPPTDGTIAINGRTINGLAPHRVAHTGVARTYQIPKPFASMSVRDNVAMAVMFGRTGASLGHAREQADRHLATVHLGHLADALPNALNLHQRQLLEMARAIAAEPAVLILDEALAGLNPAEIDDAVRVIQRIHATGISIIIVEHLLRVLQQLATRIVVLNRGELIADGEPSTVLNDQAVVHAYLGRQRA
jgi:branched-chain amino acid transport system permease protein